MVPGPETGTIAVGLLSPVKTARLAMPRPKILVFQHVPYEPLGTLDPLLKESGFRIRYVRLTRTRIS